MKRWIALLSAVACSFALPVQVWAAKVVVDPGHGGFDSGAVGVNGLMEKTVTTDIAHKLRDQLAQRGYEVVMTKDSEDVFLSLDERVQIARSAGADLFVSVHANDYPVSSAVRGSMVLYYDVRYPQSRYPASEEMRALTPQSQDLAQTILNTFVSEVGTADKGLVPSAVYVVRNGNIPSVLVETAFLSNPDDAAMLANPDIRTKMAAAIADGVESYLPPIFSDLKGHWAHDAVLRLKDRAIVQPDGRFYPERPLTRAEFVAMTSRVFNLASMAPQTDTSVTGATYGKASPQIQTTTAFKDVPSAHWAASVLKQAVQAGLLEGYPDGTLRPDQSISRGEAAALFSRLMKAAGKTVDSPASGGGTGTRTFADVPASLWSASAIGEMRQAKLIDGVDETHFAPARTITRAEMAAIVDRYVRQ